VKRVALGAARVAVLAAAFGLWELGSKAAASPYFPPPSAILATMYRRWFSGPPGHLWLTADATGNLLPSLGRMLGGWAVASLAGIVVGVAIGRSPLLADLTEPLVHFGRAIPTPTLVPVFFFLLRIGTPLEVATIIFGVIWPVLLNSIDGARHVDPVHMETARAFRIPGSQRLLRIILPGAAPKILAGLRLAMALALVMMIVSEFVGSTDGIGRELLVAQDQFDVSVIWAIIVLLGLLGVLLNLAFGVLEHRLLTWQRGSRPTT
jgi:ABC-type nitrate/sulfonate/bicarbonate transport system permease component